MGGTSNPSIMVLSSGMLPSSPEIPRNDTVKPMRIKTVVYETLSFSARIAATNERMITNSAIVNGEVAPNSIIE